MSTVQHSTKIDMEALQQEIKTLYKRIDNLISQRDSWALKYARLKEKYDAGGSTDKSQQ
jgi:hypothetical protein